MDRYGRKVALATPLIPMILLWVITANATSCAMLFASRIVIGIIGGFGPPICQVSYLSKLICNYQTNQPIHNIKEFVCCSFRSI